MITPKLEEMILAGEAVYRRESIGIGGLCSIEIEANSYMVLTDMILHPWLDVKIPAGQASTDPFISLRALNHLEIESEAPESSVFTIRGCPNQQFNWQAVPTDYYTFPGEPVKIDCYCIHWGTVVFRFANLNAPGTWVAFSNVPPEQEKVSKIGGYDPIAQVVVMAMPIGNTPGGVPVNYVPDVRNKKLLFGINAYTSTLRGVAQGGVEHLWPFLPDGTNTMNGAYQFPLVNLGFVVVKGAPPRSFVNVNRANQRQA